MYAAIGFGNMSALSIYNRLTADLRRQQEEEKQKLYGSPFASPHVTVSVDAGKDITAAAIDLQQVLSAIYNVYPDMEDAVLNGISLGKTALPILLEDTREVIFSEHVLFNIFFESEDERYLATHNAEPWGRKNLAVDVKEFDREEDALGVLVDAMYKHIKHAIKPGDHIECYGYDMKASAFNSESWYDNIEEPPTSNFTPELIPIENPCILNLG